MLKNLQLRRSRLQHHQFRTARRVCQVLVAQPPRPKSTLQHSATRFVEKRRLTQQPRRALFFKAQRRNALQFVAVR